MNATGARRWSIYDLVQSESFGKVIIFFILLSGVAVGLETSVEFRENYGFWLRRIDWVVITIFTVEILLKAWTGFHYSDDGSRKVLRFEAPEYIALARSNSLLGVVRLYLRFRLRRVTTFLKEPWNLFDLSIVVAAFLPLFGPGLVYLRLARIFRIMRLIRIIPTLPQAHVATIWSARQAFVYIAFLMSVLFYMYAVAGVFLFRENDPVHFGDIRLSMLSLFRVVTLEDWTDVMYTQMYGCDVFPYGVMEHLCVSPNTLPMISPIYFVSFILLGTIIFLNMFVGVIVTAMDDATRNARQEEIQKTLKKVLEELRAPESEQVDLQHEIYDLHAQLALVHERVGSLCNLTSQISATHGRPPELGDDKTPTSSSPPEAPTPEPPSEE